MATLFVPGRTELAGNHTDHQQGRVLVSAIHLNIRAVFFANSDSVVTIRSKGYEDIVVRLSQLSVRPAEFGKPAALVRGVAAAFQELGLNIGGFDAAVSTSLPIGGFVRKVGEDELFYTIHCLKTLKKEICLTTNLPISESV